MQLHGLHILLTYTCNYECDHCFVWGGPNQSGAFSLSHLEDVLRQAERVESIREIYFEGGEAFLYFPILVEAVCRAKEKGFWTGIVTNGYWASGLDEACTWLQPLVDAGLDQLEISCDQYHGNGHGPSELHPALLAARRLGLDTETIIVDPPTGYRDPKGATPGLPLSDGGVMYRGRAVEKLAPTAESQAWTGLSACPYENLAEPSRLHVDPFGCLHLCQGLVVGNIFVRPLKEVLLNFDPSSHPITGPLLEGGPRQLVETYALDHEAEYVDACHMCYTARQALRQRFPLLLGPDHMYGMVSA
jgi:MoaA/NifB/PqqE/SkfB family radical SAM enzyme